jgi:hypothetical protein
MNFFEQELRKMFPQQDAQFVGRNCFLRIDDAIRAKIGFRTDGTHEQYEGIEAAIINRTEGVVDRSFIRFKELLGMKQNRGGISVSPHVWLSGGDKGYEWYGYKLTAADYKMIAGAVHDYLDVYREMTPQHGRELAQGIEQQMV